MKRMLHRAIWLTPLLIVLIALGCREDPASPSIPPTEKGAWARYTPFDWTHDGRPYHSTYFTIYSDAASDEMKEQLGEIADERFGRILTFFDFDDLSDFIYPPGYSKMEIYINRHHEQSINWAYWGGFIFTIRSPDISDRRRDSAIYIVLHESTHVFEFLIEGRESLGTDVWFKEGIATHVGCLESTALRTIRSLSELESWIAQHQTVPGQGNPVKIHRHSDYPDGADQHQYYRLFELVVTYILDDKGMGRSYQDVLGLFYDLRDGISFSFSFENRFGISVGDLEDEVFDRLRAYLSNSAVPVSAMD
jgi:hypothetical protein